jgi:starch phosphorylase
MRALVELGLRASVYHMNEGHCAFLTLERIRLMMKHRKLTFHEALELAGASTVFTTHTPVPAGTDVFPAEMVEHYLGPHLKQLGLEPKAFLDWGRVNPGEENAPLNMTALALRSACFSNGVSRLHGAVARKMWNEIWPGVPENEVPIGHITNGIHPASWISHDIRQLYERYLGPRWSEEPGDTAIWQRAEQIPGEELWRTHARRRERLVAFARRRLVEQLRRRGESQSAINEAEEVLDPKALTLGFARRFATYKRATLLLRDPDRLGRILNHHERPVQIIFAGKAHPRDDEGKKLIREIVQLSREPRYRRRIVFLEDYDAVVSRYMLQGVDVWVNTPRRPMEASGTSGMKAAHNGALNLSIPDGWWDEAYSPRTGWSIGLGESYDDLEYQDRVEAGTLYDLLEREVAPLFYRRGADGVPRDWIAMMKSALIELCPKFNTNRMVHDYTMQGYIPAGELRARLQDDGCRRARELARWRDKVRRGWGKVRIVRVETDRPDDLRVGGEVAIRIWVDPGKLSASDFSVQVYMGKLDGQRNIIDGRVVPLEFETTVVEEGLLYSGSVPCAASGTHGLTVRLLPAHEDLRHEHCTRLIEWAD